MAYVVRWREPGSGTSTRSRCYWTASSAARRLAREERRPPEQRRRLHIAPFPGDVAAAKALTVCAALLMAGLMLAALVTLAS